MNNWLDNARKQIEQGEALIQMGEALITSSVAALFRDWQNPSIVLDKLCTGAERWQAAIRQLQAPINISDILSAHQHGPKIVHVSERRTRDHRIAYRQK